MDSVDSAMWLLSTGRKRTFSRKKAIETCEMFVQGAFNVHQCAMAERG